jgi:hypothetical protein
VLLLRRGDAAAHRAQRGKLHETYQCRTNKTLAAEACTMPIFRREAVEVPARTAMTAVFRAGRWSPRR